MIIALRFTSSLIMYLLLIIVTSLLINFSVQAKTVTMIRDYTYNASENDSKVSARKAALEQLQKAAIEEVGVQVQSTVVSNKSVVQGKLKQEMLLNYKLFSQALTKTKILKEKWDGENFYLKAEIEVDPDGITTAMKTLSSNNNIDACSVTLEKVKSIYKKRASIERNQALADIAIKTKFDTECNNNWQFDVLSTLIRSPEYPTKGYRSFIFEQLATAKLKDYERVTLTSYAINYAIAYSEELTKLEWETVLKKIQNIRATYISRVVASLSPLDTNIYKDKVIEIIENSNKSQLENVEKRKEILIQKIIKASINKHNTVAAELYIKYVSELHNANKIVPIITQLYTASYISQKSPSNELLSLTDKVMAAFFKNNDVESLNNTAKRYLSGLMTPLINASKRPSYNPAQDNKNNYIRVLLQHFPDEFSYLVESRNDSQQNKNLFLLKHNLPAVNLCSPSECIKQVFNRKISTLEQNSYFSYLLAYGAKAKNVETDLIKLLERSSSMVYKGTTHQRKIDIMATLVNIKTNNPKAIDLIITNLNDQNSFVIKEAISSLAALGLPAFEKMKIRFNEIKTSIEQREIELQKVKWTKKERINKENKVDHLTQQRIIEAIILMTPSKKILSFLESIPTPEKLPLQYAIEDAIEIHSVNGSD